MAYSYEFDRSKNPPTKSVRFGSRAITPDDFLIRRSYSPDKHEQKGYRPPASNQVFLQEGLFDAVSKLITKMQRKMDEIDKVREFYQILTSGQEHNDKSPVEIRCHTHNSSIILYCQWEKRLLCSNCMYGTLQHKKHEVLEANSQIDKIIDRDVKLFNKSLLPEKDQFHAFRAHWEIDLKKLDVCHREAIIQLEREHDKEIVAISNRFLEMKKMVEEKYQSGRNLFTSIIGNINKISKFYDYDNYFPSIKHIFKQFLVLNSEDLKKSVPSNKYGDYIVTYFTRFVQNVVKKYKKIVLNEK